MSTQTQEPQTAGLPEDPFGLAGRVLPRWAMGAVLVVAIALSVLIIVATPAHGRAAGHRLDRGVSSCPRDRRELRRVEGRRRAVDRLATTLIDASFVRGPRPAVAIIASADQGLWASSTPSS